MASCGADAFILVLGWVAIDSPALAHGDLHDKRIAFDREISAAPDDGSFYPSCGQIYRQHRDWPDATSDYRRAAERLAEPCVVDYYLARMWLDADRPRPARDALDRYLIFKPGDPSALVLRGRALAVLGSPLAAVDDLTVAIEIIDRPPPDLYLERARILAGAGPSHVDAALAGLTDAVARYGPLPTVIDFAIELESGRRDPAAALVWLDQAPRALQTTPLWLTRRGDLLAPMGEAGAAEARYRQAVAALDALPQRRRTSRAHRRLRDELGARLAGPCR